MPEGDTIHRTAVSLSKVLDGQLIEEAVTQRIQITPDMLMGRRVERVEARGKHLLIYLDDQHVIHSHMGMTGSWHTYRRNEGWRKPEQQAVLSMATPSCCVVCFTPKVIRRISVTQLQWDTYLQRLGPDLLGPPIPDDVFLSRIRTQSSVAIGVAVMNQSVVCGIGNVYKSEVLFLEGVCPLTLVRNLSDALLLAIRDRAVSLMNRNVGTGPRRTRFQSDRVRLWVYRRRGETCLKCGGIIEMLRQGDLARSTYWCPVCQKG
jgi:endonuclease-8